MCALIRVTAAYANILFVVQTAASLLCMQMPPRKQKTAKEEQVTLGPQLAEGENNFGVAHIFASFNDTFVHVTDLSGR